jgi:hypothetical protein
VDSSLSDAYAAARARVQAAPDRRARGPRHRIIVVRGPTVVADHTLAAHPVWGSFAVVGRHSRTRIVLPDASIDLRHLFVRSIALPDGGGVALRVLDLQTELGFVLADGSTQTSIFAEGPVLFGIGRYVLVALPRESQGDSLPNQLPTASVKSSGSARAQVAAVERAMGAYRANARHNRSSVIRLMPSLVMAGESDASHNAAHTITLARGAMSAGIPVTGEELTAGVIIGRSRKLASEELRRITDSGTSRVHVLVIREENHVFAYDLASTSGLFQEGTPVSRVLLGPKTTLTLGSTLSSVTMTWHG